MRAALSAVAALAILASGATAGASRGGAACAGGKLGLRASFQGATGATEGGIKILNQSGATCALSGQPGVFFVAGGHRLAVRQVSGKSTFGRRAMPPLVLSSGEQAFVHVRWTNWCGPRYRSVGVRFRLANAAARLRVQGSAAPPRCDKVQVASKVAVGPYEPLPQPTARATP